MWRELAIYVIIETQKSLCGETEARTKLIDQWLALRAYRSALHCETIKDRLTEIKGLLDFMVR